MKSHLTIKSTSGIQSFWNCVQSTSVSLLCSVQNFKMTGNNLWSNETTQDFNLRWVSDREIPYCTWFCTTNPQPETSVTYDHMKSWRGAVQLLTGCHTFSLVTWWRHLMETLWRHCSDCSGLFTVMSCELHSTSNHRKPNSFFKNLFRQTTKKIF